MRAPSLTLGLLAASDSYDSCADAGPEDNSGGLLPSYRTHPRMRSIDIVGMRRSLDVLLGWRFERALCCHTDPIEASKEKRRGPSSSGRGAGVGTECCSKVEWIDKFQSN